jgi:hypothetical protein
MIVLRIPFFSIARIFGNPAQTNAARACCVPLRGVSLGGILSRYSLHPLSA